jgi:hypothetical protein
MLFRSSPQKTLVLSTLLLFFALPNSSRAMTPEDARDPEHCSLFVAQTKLVKRNMRLFKFDSANTEALINDASGVRTIRGEVPVISPTATATTAAAKASEDQSLKAISGWFDRYVEYTGQMERLSRALGRYIGETVPPPPNDNPDWSRGEDEARINGRIKIFEMAIEKAEKGEATFPMKLVFPRGAKIVGKDVTFQRGSSLMPEVTFRRLKDLKTFLKRDYKELFKLQGFLISRELEQAELFVRIRKFYTSFPEGTYERLQSRLKKAEEERKAAIARGETVMDPKLDPNYSRDYALVELFRKAGPFLTGTAPQLLGFRPSQRSLEFIEQLTGNNAAQLGTVRTWEPMVRGYVKWSWDWMAAVNKYVALFRQPIVTWGSILIIWGAVKTGVVWTSKTVVKPTVNYAFYDPDEVKAREHMEKLYELRSKISDVSVTPEDFYKRFREWAQAGYSDEACTVAFEFLRKIRPSLEANDKLDRNPEGKSFTPDQLASFTRQAKDIVDIRNALLYGYNSRFGSIGGVGARLDRRGRNYFLVEELWKAGTNEYAADPSLEIKTNALPLLPKPQ